jgi:NAD(P)-dependent dehydrogenase (short-subunit alcohol dehydrogenase family)
MDLGIQGRRAVVAAASSGLGLASARALTLEGADVTLLARDEARLRVAAEWIASETGQEAPATISVDLASSREVERAIHDILSGGHVDILVTNTGGPPAKTFLECTDADWQQAFDALVMGTVRLVRSFLPGMIANGWGRIVCITSVAAKEPIENLVLSNSLRAAVTGMAKSLSREVGPHGVLVNTIAPGFHDTPALGRLIDKLLAQGKAATREEALKGWTDTVPVGKLGDARAFGRAVAFLASNACDYLTGVSLPVDGGRTRSTF